MRNPTSSCPRSRGFTLIELLVTITIVGILVAVAWPSYNASRQKTRSRQAAAEIVAMAVAIKARHQDDRAYPASLSVVKLQDRKDPWGQPYVYYNVEANGRGGARKDRALNPINSDFDLYSLGPDGKSKPQVTQKDSVDDVIRANNGAFVGVSAEF